MVITDMGMETKKPSSLAEANELIESLKNQLKQKGDRKNVTDRRVVLLLSDEEYEALDKYAETNFRGVKSLAIRSLLHKGIPKIRTEV